MKILIIAGARPNFMKVAPLLKALDLANTQGGRFEYKLVHTGQHYDAAMSDVFFKELGIRAPDINLEVGSGSHASQTASIMTRFEPVCTSEKPDCIFVVGDVNSTMACALVASKLGIKVIHLEAGLRSFDRSMPEEINRLVTDSIADLLLTPSEDADANLIKEGVAPDKIKLVGNIMIDAVVENLDQARASQVLSELKLKSQKFVYVTLHRPSNVDDPARLKALWNCLQDLSNSIPVVFPMHPRTRKALADQNLLSGSYQGLFPLNPIGYHDSLCLTENARFILTDSGGLQEESTFFHTPCLTMRPNTERPVTITIGSNRLTKLERLTDDIGEVLSKPARWGSIPEFWDGKTGQRTAALLAEWM
jgi:UDP-N-acetylglucosamine 2-epimerase (non-hydrolysing)